MKYSSLLLSCIIVLCVSVPNSFAAGTLIVSGPPKHRLLSGMNIKNSWVLDRTLSNPFLQNYPCSGRKAVHRISALSFPGEALLNFYVS